MEWELGKTMRRYLFVINHHVSTCIPAWIQAVYRNLISTVIMACLNQVSQIMSKTIIFFSKGHYKFGNTQENIQIPNILTVYIPISGYSALDLATIGLETYTDTLSLKEYFYIFNFITIIISLFFNTQATVLLCGALL